MKHSEMDRHYFHVMAALRQFDAELRKVREMVEELKDTVNTSGGGGFHFTFADPGYDSESDESGIASVQSAPATVSYEREESDD